ncbi:hypothetical protein BDB01DRAFT_724964 [Pilobolus umbonatus]|nr:hypothetical protein BDB01DRAFT_724964 [Pilobolus umbonatus]
MEGSTSLVSSTRNRGYCHPDDHSHGRPRFEPYVDPKEALFKVQKGEWYQGLLTVSRHSRNEAYVMCDTLDKDIFILGEHDRNRAFHGDTVIVELVDVDTLWNKKMKQKQVNPDNKPKYGGKVVCIPSSTRHQTTGLLAPQEGRYAIFKPNQKQMPLVAIHTKNAPTDFISNTQKYESTLLVAKITHWPIDSSIPFGVITRQLGPIGNIFAETQGILADYSIKDQPFGTKALKGLPEVPWSIKESDINHRRDLRSARIFTIDPLTAKDLDDAVHITKLDDGDFEVGVHIADVSHFVHQNTALDQEAQDRGTSTYLCDRVIPMLPPLLCEELCSLNPGVERLAFSVIWKMDSTGNIKDTWFGKTVIKSCAKLAYEDAQCVIEKKGLPTTVKVKEFAVSEVEQDIEYLYQLSKHMRGRRFENGALSINSIKLNFELNELGEPCNISIYEQKDANRLIEEFMLCANMSVAHKIASHYPDEALLRRHSPPHEKSLNEFIKIAQGLGYELDGSSAGSLQASFNAIDNENVRTVLLLLAVKPMQRAKYFCTGSVDDDLYRHYALNIPLYTHFTSPIRRFADVIVHRQLYAALSDKASSGYKQGAVEEVAAHCNDRKEKAGRAQDASIQLYLAHYLHLQKKPILCKAIITHVLKDAIEILVTDYGLEKRIYMDSLPIERFVYDGEKNTISAFWKEDVTEYEVVEDDVSNTLYSDQDVDDDVASKVVIQIPDNITRENVTQSDKRMQLFQTFDKVDVRIEVNVTKSPPIVQLFLHNPFTKSP